MKPMNEMKDFGERLEYLIRDVLKVKPKEFAMETKIGPSNLTKFTKANDKGKKVKPGQEMLELIMNRYPEVNMEWLIGGRGEPLKESRQVSANIVREHPLFKELEERVRKLESIIANFLMGNLGKSEPVLKTALDTPHQTGFLKGIGVQDRVLAVRLSA